MASEKESSHIAQYVIDSVTDSYMLEPISLNSVLPQSDCCPIWQIHTLDI